MPSGRPFINLPNPTGPGVINSQLSVPSTKCGVVIGKSKPILNMLGVYLLLKVERPLDSYRSSQDVT